MGFEVPTKCIVDDRFAWGYCIIPASEFDPTVHKEFDGPRGPAPAAPASQGQTPSGSPGLKTDGPTIEQFCAPEAGYAAKNYPPSGYAEVPSEGLTAYRNAVQAVAGPADAVIPTLASLVTSSNVAWFKRAESEGRNRKTVLEAIDAAVKG